MIEITRSPMKKHLIKKEMFKMNEDQNIKSEDYLKDSTIENNNILME